MYAKHHPNSKNWQIMGHNMFTDGVEETWNWEA